MARKSMRKSRSKKAHYRSLTKKKCAKRSGKVWRKSVGCVKKSTKRRSKKRSRKSSKKSSRRRRSVRGGSMCGGEDFGEY